MKYAYGSERSHMLEAVVVEVGPRLGEEPPLVGAGGCGPEGDLSTPARCGP